MTTSAPQIERFARQIALPDVGAAGQEKIARARVAVKLGNNPACEHALLVYLAAAGIGHLSLRGGGAISRSEIAHGLLFEPADEGADRVATLARRLATLNPDVRVDTAAGDEPALAFTAAPAASLADGFWHGGAAALDVLCAIGAGA